MAAACVCVCILQVIYHCEVRWKCILELYYIGVQNFMCFLKILYNEKARVSHLIFLSSNIIALRGSSLCYFYYLHIKLSTLVYKGSWVICFITQWVYCLTKAPQIFPSVFTFFVCVSFFSALNHVFLWNRELDGLPI